MAEIVDMLAERAQQGAALRKLHKDMESTLQVAPRAGLFLRSLGRSGVQQSQFALHAAASCSSQWWLSALAAARYSS
jgi:hypothetical protein